MRVAFAGLLAVLTASLVTACGGDTLALDPVADAATKTEAAKSMRLELTMALSTPGAGPPLKITAAGAVDGDRSRLRLAVPPVAGVPLGTFELRSDADALYLRMPLLQAMTPAAKPWLKLDLDDVGRHGGGLDLDSLLTLGRQSNPTQALDYLRAAGDVKKVGTERVRGVETTHYRAVVDLERFAESLDEGLAAAVRQVTEATGATTMPMDLWVDEDSLVRRLTWTQKVPIQPGREPSQASLSLDLFDFGADVDIDLPSADETTPFGTLGRMGETG